MLDCGESLETIDWCDIVVIGPGIGTTHQAAEKAITVPEAASGAAKRVILDADGLVLWTASANGNSILIQLRGHDTTYG